MLLRERPHRGALLRGLDVLVRREVVGHERDLLPVEHLGAPELGDIEKKSKPFNSELFICLFLNKVSKN